MGPYCQPGHSRSSRKGPEGDRKVGRLRVYKYDIYSREQRESANAFDKMYIWKQFWVGYPWGNPPVPAVCCRRGLCPRRSPSHCRGAAVCEGYPLHLCLGMHAQMRRVSVCWWEQQRFDLEIAREGGKIDIPTFAPNREHKLTFGLSKKILLNFLLTRLFLGFIILSFHEFCVRKNGVNW